MNTEPNPYQPGKNVNVPNLDEIGYRTGFSPTAFGMGLFGAVVGGVAGYFLYGLILTTFGLDGLCIPGAALGFGFSIAARRSHPAYGIFCGVAGFALGLITEWIHAPFIADESLTFFLANVGKLSIMTWIMILLGAFLAWSFGKGYR